MQKNLKILLIGLLLLNIAQFSKAIEYGGLGGRPAYPRSNNPRTDSIFVHILEPNTEQKDGIMVINNTKDKKTIMVYAVDSVVATGGVFACAQASANKTDVGSWIILDKTELILESGANEIIDFTIKVPENTSVGEHSGCIIVQEKKTASVKSGVNLDIRTGLRVLITVPGNIVKKLEIAGLTITQSKNKFLLHPQIRNLGNVSIDANIKIITRNVFGSIIFINSSKYSVLRGQTLSLNFESKKPIWGGIYSSVLNVDYDANLDLQPSEQNTNLTHLSYPKVVFYSSPSLQGLIIEIIIISLLIVIINYYLKSKNQQQLINKTWILYEIKPEDNINSLAKDFNVSWQLLVKVNKLQAPYILKPGEKIKTPPIK